MIRPTRAFTTALATLVVAVAMAFTAASALAAEEAVVVHYTPESLPQFESQLHGGQIASVTFNKRLRTMRITLKDGTHVLAKYPPKSSAVWIKNVEARHVPVTILTPTEAKKEQKSSHHHKLRYIAGGILLLVIIIVVVVVLLRRRRNQD